MNYTCMKNLKSHTGKNYRTGQEITIIEFNTLTFSERESFIRVDKKTEQFDMESEHANEL